MKSFISGAAELVRGSVPVPYTASLFSVLTAGVSATTRNLGAMQSTGTLFSIVNRTSTSCAKVCWYLYRKSATGDIAKRTRVPKHWALEVWDRPNTFMSRMEFVEIVQQHMDLTGEMWWLVARDPRVPSLPSGLWPIRPDKMAPVPHPTEYISHYEYTAPNGNKIRLERDEVIFIKMPNPMDPFRGLGPVQSVLMDIDSSRYSAEWNRNFFLNGAEPGGIVKADRELSDRQFEKLQQRWDEQHRGVSNAHRVAILENMDWIERKYTNKDMQFVELRQVSRDVIREAFGMPKFAVGDVDDVNRNTAEASSDWFDEQITSPRLDRIKGALNERYLPLFGAGTDMLEFDYELESTGNYEREVAERNSKVSAFKTLVIDVGVEPKEASAYLELPEFTVEKPEPPPPPAPPGQDPAVEPDDDESAATPEDMRRLAIAMARVFKGRGSPKGPRAQLDDETDARIQHDADRMAADWENRLDRVLARWTEITAVQRDELVEQVRQAAKNDDVEALSDLTASTGQAIDLLLEELLLMWGQGVDQVADSANAQGVDLERPEPGEDDHNKLAAFAGATAMLLASGLSDSVAREALRLWGLDADEMARTVRDFVDDMSDRGLRDQLGGALTKSMNSGRFIAMLTDDTAAWYATERNDRNACSPCKTVDETRYDSLAAALLDYPAGGYVKCEGGVRCRGGVVPVWEV